MPNGKTRPRWEDKIWGKTLHLFYSPYAGVSYLKVEKDSWCSRHIHKERANIFISISAILEVEEQDLDGNETITLLEPGDSYEVPSGVLHRFKVLESGDVVEIYHADRGGIVSFEDIHRKDVGGKNG